MKYTPENCIYKKFVRVREEIRVEEEGAFGHVNIVAGKDPDSTTPDPYQVVEELVAKDPTEVDAGKYSLSNFQGQRLLEIEGSSSCLDLPRTPGARIRTARFFGDLTPGVEVIIVGEFPYYLGTFRSGRE